MMALPLYFYGKERTVMIIKLGKDKQIEIDSYDLAKILSTIVAVSAAITEASKYKSIRKKDS